TVEDLCIYETHSSTALPDDVLGAMRDRKVDYITFTSSSTARNFIDLLGAQRPLLDGVKLASIGPITSQTMRELGLTVAVEAAVFDIDGLVNVLRESAR